MLEQEVFLKVSRKCRPRGIRLLEGNETSQGEPEHREQGLRERSQERSHGFRKGGTESLSKRFKFTTRKSPEERTKN